MSVNPITAYMPVHQMQPDKTDGTLNKSFKNNTPSIDQVSNQSVKTTPLDAITEVSKAIKPTPDSGIGINSKPAGVVSHVVVSYNQQGKMRTKFEDSRNNVVYQIPSEMVAKIEDQMMKPETSTNIKG